MSNSREHPVAARNVGACHRRVPMRRRLMWAVLTLLALLCVAVSLRYHLELRAIRQELSQSSALAPTRHGALEYVRWGDGPAVLVIHGAGGGHDHGRLIAERFGGDGFDWIAVSRFGYLRSALPQQPTTAAQAEACADLLDTLGVPQVFILAMSGGVPPALQFATLYPQRTSGLLLLSSAPYTPLGTAEQDLPLPAWAYQALFRSNFPYWLITKLAPHRLNAVFDVTPELSARMNSEDRAFLAAMVAGFQPVSERTAGLANEGAAIATDAHYALDQIGAPTLVVHARDDRINTHAIAEHTAQGIAGAELLSLADGGHLLLGHHDMVREQVRKRLLRGAVSD